MLSSLTWLVTVILDKSRSVQCGPTLLLCPYLLCSSFLALCSSIMGLLVLLHIGIYCFLGSLHLHFLHWSCFSPGSPWPTATSSVSLLRWYLSSEHTLTPTFSSNSCFPLYSCSLLPFNILYRFLLLYFLCLHTVWAPWEWWFLLVLSSAVFQSIE